MKEEIKLSDDMWYNGNELITKGRLFNFLIGVRGGGKTFWWKKKCIDDFLNKGKEFIWLRRYDSELTEMKSWASALQREGYFNDVKFECSKKYIKVNGVVAGYVGTLSKSQHIKSNEYPSVNKIVLDEFLIKSGSHMRYMKNECSILIDIAETIFRYRDKGNIVVAIGNAVSVVNPYFTELNIQPNIYERFTMDRDITIEMYNNPQYSEMKKKSRLGKIASRVSGYGEYMYENKFLSDKNSFIKKRVKGLVYCCTIIYEEKQYGVWNNFNNGEFYIDRVVEKDSETVIVVDINELNGSGKLMSWKGYNNIIGYLNESMSEGKVWFSDITTKTKMYSIFKLV